MRRFFARLRNLLWRRSAERRMSREIDSHVALLEEEYERRGLTPDDARLAARRAYGGIETAKELHRDARSFVWVEQRFKDLAYGVRSLLHTPGFTTLAVITLALGIGANTAIFSVVNAVLLQPLPYKDPGRLVTVLHDGRNPVAAGNYIDWRDQSRSFDAMAAAEAWGANLTGIDQPEHLSGLQVTQNLLPMLGIQPLLGRLFRPGEDQPGSEHEAILSYRLWQRRFNGDPGVLGKVVTLDGQGYVIVGVMPPEFQFPPFWATRAELWVPDAFGADRLHSRGGNSLRVFARLKRGVTLAQARAEIATITGRLERQYPGTNRNVEVTPLKENVTGNIETPLLILLGAVGFVLLIACANVAHMLMARTSDRAKEVAVRTALGASRGRVIGQFLTEDLLLASCGAIAGLLLAIWGTKALVALAPAFIPRVQTTSINSDAALFTLGLTLLTTLIFGLVPAIHAGSGELTGALKEGGRGGGDDLRRTRLRGFLVASEFTLAFILLIGAGLMVRSFVALESVDPGFNPHGVLSMIVSVAGSREDEPGHRAIFYRQLLERIRSMPGVQSAGAINHLPLAGDLWGLSFRIAGRPKPRPGESPSAVYRVVMPGYFETMRLPVLRGRAMTDADDARASGVVVINETAARHYWPGTNPLGQRIAVNEDSEHPKWLTIIGIVKDAAEHDWAGTTSPETYLAALQQLDSKQGPATHADYITLVVRAAGDPAQLAPVIKKAVWSFDRNLPISEVLTMDDAVAEATAQPRFEMLLLGIFAAVALALAAVGIYGVMSYAVSRRTHEIGIRMSLGAGRMEVLRLVVLQGMLQALVGSAAGICGALLLSRLMAGLLYGVRPTDPVTFSSVAAVLAITALLAVYIPARRATRIEPMIALRHE